MKQAFLTLVLSIILIACGDKPSSSKRDDIMKSKKEKTVQSSVSSSDANEEETTEEQDSASMTKEQIDKAKEIIKSVSASDLAKVDPKKVFKIHCALCHGFTGDMMVNGAKDLTKSEIPIEESVAQVYHGKGLMTPYKGVLKDAEIVAVCQYIEKEIRR